MAESTDPYMYGVIERTPWDLQAPPEVRARWRYDWYGTWWVYFIYDRATDELLYIGFTNDVVLRLSKHHYRRRYPRDQVRHEVQGPFLARAVALEAEAHYIRTMGPRDNRRVAA